jgi:hypothetical protein
MLRRDPTGTISRAGCSRRRGLPSSVCTKRLQRAGLVDGGSWCLRIDAGSMQTLE